MTEPSLSLVEFFARFPSNAFDFLDVKARSRLKQSCKALRDVVESFDKEKATGIFTDPKGDPDARSSHHHRVDLIETTARLRWLANSDKRTFLQRITSGDFSKYGNARVCRYYDKAMIADGNLWVLWYDYFEEFEVYNLDTDGRLSFVLEHGPNSYDVNTESIRIRLMLEDEFDARFGLLVGTMWTTGSPHGPCSGPYLRVWELPTTDTEGGSSRLHVDMRRPELLVNDVKIVPRSMVAVLLVPKGERTFRQPLPCEHCDDDPERTHSRVWDTGAVLQWHRIPVDTKEMSGAPPPIQVTDPGPPPPDQRCSMQCLISACPERMACEKWKWLNRKWQEQCRSEGQMKETNDGSKNDADDTHTDEPEYRWWSFESTLVSEREIHFHDEASIQEFIEDGSRPEVSFKMNTDGKGLLVLLVWNEIQFWHVGSQKLVRTCSLGDLNFFPLGSIVVAFEVHTAVFPTRQKHTLSPHPIEAKGASLLSECDLNELQDCFA